jgi:hypothetical protein
MKTHVRTMNPRASATLWWTAAIFMWLFSIPLCLMLARDLIGAPGPNLQTWKTVAELLPVLPILGTFVILVVAALRKRPLANALLLAAKVLLWCSVAVVLVAIPKAP